MPSLFAPNHASDLFPTSGEKRLGFVREGSVYDATPTTEIDMSHAALKPDASRLLARFARKPYDLHSALRETQSLEHSEPITIEATQALTPVAYDVFVARFFESVDWLAGRGGFENGRRLVIEVTAPQRRTLYIDPSGSDYARYVGFAEES